MPDPSGSTRSSPVDRLFEHSHTHADRPYAQSCLKLRSIRGTNPLSQLLGGRLETRLRHVQTRSSRRSISCRRSCPTSSCGDRIGSSSVGTNRPAFAIPIEGSTAPISINKKMNRALVDDIATGRFVAQREDALLLGTTGDGEKLSRPGHRPRLEVIVRRYGRPSTLLTSNRPVDDWGKLLGGDLRRKFW